MKSFLTRVTVGEFSAEGEGNSKKLSKKRAALSILQDLKKLPFIPAVEKPKTHYKKRTKTILKVLQLGFVHTSNYSFQVVHSEILICDKLKKHLVSLFLYYTPKPNHDIISFRLNTSDVLMYYHCQDSGK